jgi:large subunit ribosomal protein L18
MRTQQRSEQRERRQKRTRKQLRACERPLLTVYRSSRHLYAQIVDPGSGRTVTAASTLSPAVREGLKSSCSVPAAKKLGAEIARLAIEKSIRQVAFNRNGFVYHGRIKALADAAREAGLQF